MEPVSQQNLPLSVRRRADDVDPLVAPFYTDIYDVLLRYSLTVSFVPAFPRDAVNWPPVLPDNLDLVVHPEDARRWLVGMGGYSITPDAAHAGQMEVIPAAAADLTSGLVFYTTPAEFDTFQTELEALADDMIGLYDSRPVSALGDRAFVRFLLARVLPQLIPGDRRMLGL